MGTSENTWCGQGMFRRRTPPSPCCRCPRPLMVPTAAGCSTLQTCMAAMERLNSESSTRLQTVGFFSSPVTLSVVMWHNLMVLYGHVFKRHSKFSTAWMQLLVLFSDRLRSTVTIISHKLNKTSLLDRDVTSGYCSLTLSPSLVSFAGFSLSDWFLSLF